VLAAPIGLLVAQFPPPLADGLLGYGLATDRAPLFDISVTAAEPVSQPDRMEEEIPGQAVGLVAVR
jgi:hypothetical protein